MIKLSVLGSSGSVVMAHSGICLEGLGKVTKALVTVASVLADTRNVSQAQVYSLTSIPTCLFYIYLLSLLAEHRASVQRFLGLEMCIL
jgi:hypothetical protein